MNSRKPKQSHEQVNPTRFEELQLQLVVPDQTPRLRQAHQQTAATISVRLPAAKARTLH